jgi:hypothetical protein
MSVVLEIHLVLAFLVALCAVVFSWTPNGRRVVNAVVALQFVVGLVVAAVMGARHMTIPPAVWLHLLIALGVLACYGMAVRAGKRAGGRDACVDAFCDRYRVDPDQYRDWVAPHDAGRGVARENFAPGLRRRPFRNRRGSGVVLFSAT